MTKSGWKLALAARMVRTSSTSPRNQGAGLPEPSGTVSVEYTDGT